MLKRLFLFLFCFGLSVASAWGQSDEQPKYPRYNFNVGAGLGMGRGAVANFVGNSFEGTAGAGLNFGPIFGLSAEYMYYNLDPRPWVSNSQSVPDTTGSMNSVSLNGLVRSPYHLGRFGSYGIFGVGFYRRSVSVSPSQLLPPGTVCQQVWERWWDVYCFPMNQVQNPDGVRLSSFSKIAGGYNMGGGITYSLEHWHHAKVYAEFRLHKAYFSDVQSEVWPITVGLRW